MNDINFESHNLKSLQQVITILTQFESVGVVNSKDIKQRLNDYIQNKGVHGRVSKRVQKIKPTPSKLNDMAKTIPLCPECHKRMTYYLYDSQGRATLDLDKVVDGEYVCIPCGIGQYVGNPLNLGDE